MATYVRVTLRNVRPTFAWTVINDLDYRPQEFPPRMKNLRLPVFKCAITSRSGPPPLTCWPSNQSHTQESSAVDTFYVVTSNAFEPPEWAETSGSGRTNLWSTEVLEGHGSDNNCSISNVHSSSSAARAERENVRNMSYFPHEQGFNLPSAIGSRGRENGALFLDKLPWKAGMPVFQQGDLSRKKKTVPVHTSKYNLSRWNLARVDDALVVQCSEW